MINLLKKQRPSSVLGLGFDGNRLEAVVLRRTNGSFQVQKTVTIPLTLPPFTSNPELVGREIRNHLDQAGVRERRCVVCLPLNWVMALHVQMPDLPEADRQSFLQLEAERGYPAGLETLVLAQSHCASGNERHTSLLAVSRTSIANLESLLKAAQLKPLSFSLGLAALQRPNEEAALTLSLGIDTAELQVTCGGGIAALRSLDGAVETEGSQKRLDAELLGREIRITLGQLPAAFQKAVRTFRIFGRGDLARRLVAEISPRAESMGLKVEAVEHCSQRHFANVLPAEAPLTPALALAASYLGGTPNFEFLPPKVHPWQQLVSSKFSSKKLAWAGAPVGLLALVVIVAFLIQQWKISSLERQWKEMEARVTELDNDTQQIKKFRPWFDKSFPALNILRRLTEAFPDNGNVSAKTFEIREPATVTCSGVAINNQAFLKLQDTVRSTKGITGLNVESTRGLAPEQFTFSFQWEGDKANAN